LRIILTGSAGFIGYHLALKLLERGDEVSGIDNHNDYYDPSLKEARLSRLKTYENYTHFKIDLKDQDKVNECFSYCGPQFVINLAAQAGVRYSIENPLTYIESNIVGFAHVLEACRKHSVEHLVFASSSSVYGANTETPYSVHHNVSHPLSLYASSKISNELMAHSYSHLYNLAATGLRFFTVYGPWGRPDMAPFKFTKAILAGEKLQVFNFGKHRRDFTYIDDIVQGILCVLDKPAKPNLEWDGANPDPASSMAPWRIYNIGNNNPIELMDFILALEKVIGRKAEIDFQPIQPGDVDYTCADISDLQEMFQYKPSTPIEVGVEKFVNWYNEYFKI